MKYEFITEYKLIWRIKTMCRVLKVSKSGYYKYLKKSAKEQFELENKLKLIEEIYKSSRCTYGSRKVPKSLKAKGISCYKNQIAKIMKQKGLFAKGRKRYKITTNSKHNLPIAPNIVSRNFEIDEKNKVWVSDITYISTQNGWLYLSAVLDLYSRKIVGWCLSDRMTKQLVISSLQEAINSRRPEKGLVFHSDQGSQYASTELRNIINSIGGIQSMSRRGNCWDNAVAESFFKTLKTELINNEHFKTKEEAEMKLFDYIEIFYNRQRIHSSNDYLSPVEYEERNC